MGIRPPSTPRHPDLYRSRAHRKKIPARTMLMLHTRSFATAAIGVLLLRGSQASKCQCGVSTSLNRRVEEYDMSFPRQNPMRAQKYAKKREDHLKKVGAAIQVIKNAYKVMSADSSKMPRWGDAITRDVGLEGSFNPRGIRLRKGDKIVGVWIMAIDRWTHWTDLEDIKGLIEGNSPLCKYVNIRLEIEHHEVCMEFPRCRPVTRVKRSKERSNGCCW